MLNLKVMMKQFSMWLPIYFHPPSKRQASLLQKLSNVIKIGTSISIACVVHNAISLAEGISQLKPEEVHYQINA
jgi:hypothetical protein